MGELIERLKENRLLTFNEMREICYRELDDLKCDDLILDVKEYKHDGNSISARFSHYDRKIYLDIDNMDLMSKKSVDFFSKQSPIDERHRKIFENFFHLVTIYHEINHVLDYKKYFNKEFDEFEQYLYSISQDMKRRRDLYFQYNLCYPTERCADLTGYTKTFSLYLNLDLEKKNLLNIQKFIIILLSSYYEKKGKILVSPFEKIMMEYDPEELDNKIQYIYKSINGYNEYKKAMLGLPLYSQELHEIDKLYNKKRLFDITKKFVKK